MADNIPGADPTPDVAPQALPTPFDGNRTTPDTFGAQTGDVIQHAGAVAAAYQQKMNAVAVEQAFGQAQKALNDVILDPKQGYLSLKGADAVAQSDKYTGKFTQAISDIRGSLQTEAQRRELGFRLDRLQETGLRLAASHERGQHDVIADATSKGAEMQSTTSLIATASNPGLDDDTLRNTLRSGVSDLIESSRQDAVYRYGQAASPEAIKAIATPKIQQAAALAVESAMATENPAHAQRVYDTLKPFLGTRSGLLAENQIQRRADQRDGLAWAQITAMNSRIPGTTLLSDDVDAKLDELRKSGDRPEKVKVAEEELQRLKVMSRQAQADRNKSAFTTGIAAINKGDLTSLNRAVDVLSVPEADGGDYLERLLQFKSSVARKDLNSPEAQRDYALAANDAQEMLGVTRATGTTFNDFLLNKTRDGRTLAEALSPVDLKKFGAAFEQKREHEASDKPLSSEATKQVLEGIAGAGLYPDPNVKGVAPTDDQIRVRNRVIDYVRGQRNQSSTYPKQEPGREDYDRWINEEVGKVPGSASPGFWSFLRSDRSRVEIELEQAKAAPQPTPSAQTAPPAPTPAPAAPKAAPAAPAAPPTINNKADYDKLPSGADYIDARNGIRKRKA